MYSVDVLAPRVCCIARVCFNLGQASQFLGALYLWLSLSAATNLEFVCAEARQVGEEWDPPM